VDFFENSDFQEIFINCEDCARLTAWKPYQTTNECARNFIRFFLPSNYRVDIGLQIIWIPEKTAPKNLPLLLKYAPTGPARPINFYVFNRLKKKFHSVILKVSFENHGAENYSYKMTFLEITSYLLQNNCMLNLEGTSKKRKISLSITNEKNNKK